MSSPRVVVVHRRTEYEELLARHATRGQAEFFLSTRGRSLDEVEALHHTVDDSVRLVQRAIPADWRRAQVEREELSRFVFGPEDVVAVIGQDGLVANVAKYLSHQPVVGFNPAPLTYMGVLVPHATSEAGRLVHAAVDGTARVLERTMLEAVSDDGQRLVALNDIYVGQPTHQSARYTLTVGGSTERQSSSGIVVGTGTGATGWCASLQRAQAPTLRLPRPADPALAWFVREPWPSPSTQAGLLAGILAEGEALVVRVESDSLVVFGDGMESDRVSLTWGQELTVRRSGRTLRTVV